MLLTPARVRQIMPMKPWKLLCGGLERKVKLRRSQNLAKRQPASGCGFAFAWNTTRAAVEKAAAEAAKWAQGQLQVEIDLSRLSGAEAALLVEVLTLAIGQAVYRFERFKKEAKPAKLQPLAFYLPQDSAAAEEALHIAQALNYGMNLCKDLGNTAPNVCTPAFLAQTAKAEAEQAGATAKILEQDYIRDNMGSFWSVAKGSVEAPYLIELNYQGAADKNAAPLVLVGKGITFDTGGISLKPGEAMDEK